MSEDGFKPEDPAIEVEIEKSRKNLIDEIEKLHHRVDITIIMERLGITIAEPFKDLPTAKEALQSFIRGFNKSQLESTRRVIEQMEEEFSEL